MAEDARAGNIVHEKVYYLHDDPILKDLDQDQKIAVTIPNDAVLQMLAGPGTGKTTALVHRTAWLIKHYKLDPRKIILMTFTNQAAKELNERISVLLSKSQSSPTTNIPQGKVKTGTFHSICLRYLVQYGSRVGIKQDFTVVDENAQKKIVQEIFQLPEIVKLADDHGYKLDKRKENFEGSYKKKINFWYIHSMLSRIRSSGVETTDFEQTNEGQNSKFELAIIKQYELVKRMKNVLDFDDLLFFCARLLRHSPGIVDDIEHVLVDEFQDTDESQYSLAKLFAQRNNNITIVGDPDQSIYSFRHATTKNFYTMRDDFPHFQRVYLNCNYRSTNDIVNLSQEVIKLDNARVDRERQLHAKYSGPKTLGAHLVQFQRGNQEMRAIATHIKTLVSLQDNPFLYSDFAILFRYRYRIKDMEFALNQANVPYRVVGSRSFWEIKEVKIIMSFFLAIKSDSQDDSTIAAIKTQKIGLGEKSIESIDLQVDRGYPTFMSKLRGVAVGSFTPKSKLSQKAIEGISKFVKLIQECRKELKNSTTTAGFEKAFGMVCEYSKVVEIIVTESPRTEESVQRNLQLILEKIQSLGPGESDAKNKNSDYNLDDIPKRPDGTPDYLTAFLQSCSLGLADMDEESSELDYKNKVTIMTMHGSKGLEWPIVFIPYLSYTTVIKTENENEERRIFYVSITRGKSACYLTYSTDGENNQDNFGGFSKDSNGVTYESFLPKNTSEGMLQQSTDSIPRITNLDVKSTQKFLRRYGLTKPENTAGYRDFRSSSSAAALADAPAMRTGFASASSMIDSSALQKAVELANKRRTKRPMAPGSFNNRASPSSTQSKISGSSASDSSFGSNLRSAIDKGKYTKNCNDKPCKKLKKAGGLSAWITKK